MAHFRKTAPTIRNFLLRVFSKIITMKVPVILPSWTMEPKVPNSVSFRLRSFLTFTEEDEMTPPSEQLNSWMNQKMKKIIILTHRDRRNVLLTSLVFWTKFSFVVSILYKSNYFVVFILKSSIQYNRINNNLINNVLLFLNVIIIEKDFVFLKILYKNK